MSIEAARLASLSAKKADTWKILTLKDAYEQREPLLYAINGLYSFPSLSICYGSPSSLKSFFLADQMVAVSAGIPWLGRAVHQVPSLWIDFDNGQRRTSERIEALARKRNLPDDVPINYISMPDPWLNAASTDQIEMLIDRSLRRGIKFICIDNLGSITHGADENSSEMIKVMKGLRILAEKTEGAVIVIHHSRKSSGMEVRAGDALRGHSSIEAAIDLALRIDRKDGDAVVTIRSTKTRDVDVRSFSAKFQYEHKPGTKELSAAWFETAEMDDPNSDSVVEQAILRALSVSKPLNQTQLISSLKDGGIKAGKNRIAPVAERMAERHQIVIAVGSRNEKLYSLAESSGHPASPP